MWHAHVGETQVMLCGKRVKRKSLITLMSQPRSYEFFLGRGGGELVLLSLLAYRKGVRAREEELVGGMVSRVFFCIATGDS